MCGYVITGASVTLTAGYVFWGKTTLSVAASSPITVTGSCFYGLQATMSAAQWVSKASVVAFEDTDDTLFQFYYQFNVTDGKAYLVSIGAQGNWKIPGVFAPG
jgi:hypothetical protein